jgi:hypothetical protein
MAELGKILYKCLEYGGRIAYGKRSCMTFPGRKP